MEEKKSSLLKAAVIYTLGGVAGQAVPFILLPILTRYLTPKDYGLIATFQAILGVTIPFVGINVTNAITRSYYDLKKSDMAVYIGNCMIILFSSFLIVFLVFVIFRQTLSSLVSFPANWLLVIPAVAAGRFLFNTILSIWRVRNKAVAFNAYNISMTSVNFMITIVLVVFLSMNWQGRVVGITAAYISFGLISFSILFFQGDITFRRKREYIQDALKMGGPLIPHMLGAWARNTINRLFLNRMVGLSVTGIYSVGSNFGSIISLFQGAFHQAWIPWLYAKLKQNRPADNLRIVKFTYLYHVVSILMALVFTQISYWLLPFCVGSKFVGASYYVLWISLGMAADGMNKMVVGYLYFNKKTHLLALVTVFTGSLSVLLNYVLIKQNGSIGAAQATAATFFIGFLLTWFAASRVYPMPWNLISIEITK